MLLHCIHPLFSGIPSTPMRVMVDSSVPLKVTLMVYLYSGSSTLTFPVTATSKTGGPTHTFTVVVSVTSLILTNYNISIELYLLGCMQSVSMLVTCLVYLKM